MQCGLAGNALQEGSPQNHSAYSQEQQENIGAHTLHIAKQQGHIEHIVAYRTPPAPLAGSGSLGIVQLPNSKFQNSESRFQNPTQTKPKFEKSLKTTICNYIPYMPILFCYMHQCPLYMQHPFPYMPILFFYIL